jgi:hypothetical protein
VDADAYGPGQRQVVGCCEHYNQLLSQYSDSSVDIETGYVLNDRDLISGMEQDISL